jgi:triacylglycerol lipase
VPILIGANTDEGTAFGPTGINTTAQFQAFVSTRLTNPNASIDTITTLYPDIPGIGIPQTFLGRPSGTTGLQYKRSSSFAGDYTMHANRRGATQAWSNYSVPSFSYRFNALANGYSYTQGVTHFEEVAFVMNTVNGDGYAAVRLPNPFGGEPLSYREISRLMSRMWVSFVNTLDPNYSGSKCCSC